MLADAPFIKMQLAFPVSSLFNAKLPEWHVNEQCDLINQGFRLHFAIAGEVANKSGN